MTIKTKKLNVNFKEGQTVVCTSGWQKGKVFTIALVSDSMNGYSCKSVDPDNKNYSSYDDRHLELYNK